MSDSAADARLESSRECESPSFAARRFGIGVAVITLAALAMRIASYLQTHLIFTDSAHYVDMARMLLRGDYAGVVNHEYHPLFAVGIAATSWLGDDLVTNAMLFAVVVGALAVVPLAFALRRVGGPAVGWVGALAYAFSPYPVQYAAAGNSESLYFLVFLGAVAVGLRALERDDPWHALACAFLSGLAYLVRPEGAGVFGVVFAILVVRALRRRDRRAWRVVLPCFVLFALAGVGYVALEYKQTGEIRLTAKKSILKMLGIGNQDEVPAAGARERLGPGEIAGRVVTNLASSMSYPLAVFAIVGAFVNRRKRRPAELHLLAVFLAYTLVLAALLNGYGYLSRRHATPVSTLALGWSAIGLLAFVRAAAGVWAGRKAGRSEAVARRWIGAVVFLALAGLFSAKALEPQWPEQVALRRAGEWIRTERDRLGGMHLVTPYKWADPVIPAYGGVRIDQPTVANSAELFSYLHGIGADHLAVIDERMDRRCADPERVLEDSRLELVHREPYDDGERAVLVFRYLRTE